MINNNLIYLRKLYSPPPSGHYYKYINVNKNKDLRNSVTKFFHKKLIKWINKYSEYKHLKKYLKKIESDEGFNIVFKIIKKFLKKNNLKWWDAKKHYFIIKDYLKVKVTKYI